MAFEQNFQRARGHCEYVGDVGFKQNWKSVSEPKTSLESIDGCFECNICLDSARDPVVTLCGHLYCWPCIYKWLHVQTSSPESGKLPKCPVCKSNISNSSLVPLYGRGNSPSESEPKKIQQDLVIPRRPPALSVATRTNPQLHSSPFRSFHHQQYFPHPFGNYTSMAPPNFVGNAMSSFFSPTIVMFGEMVFGRMFGSSDTSLFSYPYPNSYPLMGGSGSPRVRRLELQVDKSLNRVSIFLLCCFILCLLLF